jgi:hypothetical protein
VREGKGVARQRPESSRDLTLNPGAPARVSDFVRIQVLARPFAYVIRQACQQHENDQGFDRRPRERTSVSNDHETGSAPHPRGDEAWIEWLIEPKYERVHGHLRPSEFRSAQEQKNPL